MATIVDENFDSGSLAAYSTTGGPVLTAGAAQTGAFGLVIDTTDASSEQIFRALPAGHRSHTFRFYLKVVQDTSGSASIYQVDNVNGTFVVQLRTGRRLRLYLGGTTSADSATVMNLNQWYRIDGRFIVVLDGTASIDLQIDGTAMPQLSRTQALADMTIVRVGNTATNTYIAHMDTWKVTDVLGDYPLGAVGGSSISANAIPASGTGALLAHKTHVKPNGPRAAGTGMTWQGITGDLVVAGPLAAGQGGVIGTDAQNGVIPDANPATGTGAVLASGRSSKATAAHAAGAGAAYAPSRTQVANAEYATGLGAAHDSVPSANLSVAASLASGTGASTDADPFTTQSGASLTMFMGMA